MPAIIMTKILQLVAGGSKSGAIDVTLKMVTIFDLPCRSRLVVGASRELVARWGFGAMRLRTLCTQRKHERKGAGGR